MKLQELVTQLQSLCDQGYSEMAVEISLEGGEDKFTECTADLVNKIITVS